MKMCVAALLASVTLTACSGTSGGGQEVDPHTWTCESLKQPVIEMSQKNDVKILEINSAQKSSEDPGRSISCEGSAEWSQGGTGIDYGAHVSEGGQVILEYKRF